MSARKFASARSTPLILLAPLLVFALAGCATEGGSVNEVQHGQSLDSEPDLPSNDDADEQPPAAAQEETCDWESPKLSAPADIPDGQLGELSEVLVGAWQHTHTDDGSGFEEVANDHRYVFSSPDRMLYCQHVPGATEHEENAANVVLNDTAIELPGGKYAYTVMAWDQDTLVWDNPVGGGYVYLLQRR